MANSSVPGRKAKIAGRAQGLRLESGFGCGLMGRVSSMSFGCAQEELGVVRICVAAPVAVAAGVRLSSDIERRARTDQRVKACCTVHKLRFVRGQFTCAYAIQDAIVLMLC